MEWNSQYEKLLFLAFYFYIYLLPKNTRAYFQKLFLLFINHKLN